MVVYDYKNTIRLWVKGRVNDDHVNMCSNILGEVKNFILDDLLDNIAYAKCTMMNRGKAIGFHLYNRKATDEGDDTKFCIIEITGDKYAVKYVNGGINYHTVFTAFRGYGYSDISYHFSPKKDGQYLPFIEMELDGRIGKIEAYELIKKLIVEMSHNKYSEGE